MANATDTNDRSGNGFHGTGTALTTGSDGPAAAPVEIPPGIVQLPLGYSKTAQHVIRRYSNGTNHPAGQLRGWGPGSLIAATAQTASLPVDTRAVVITEDYDKTIAQWQSGPVGVLPAVLQTQVRDCTIAGYDDTGMDYADPGVVGSWVWTEEGQGGTTLTDDLYDLALIRSTGAVINGVNLFYGPGTALVITRGSNDILNGQERPFDKEKFSIHRVRIDRCFRGISVATIDGTMGNIEIANLRDYGIKIESGAAAVQFDGTVHIWGIGSNGANYTDIGDANPTVSPGACLWVSSGAGGNWGGPWYVETSRIGMLLDGAANSFGPIHSLNCFESNITIVGERNTIHNVQIDIADGITEINGGQGIWIANQDTTVRDVVFRHVDPNTGAAGQRVPSGEICIRITNGNRLMLTGINIYGTRNSTAPLMRVEGKIGETDVTLNDSIIEIVAQGGHDVLDLYSDNVDRIGSGNRIWVSTWDISGYPIKLAPVWLPESDNNLNDVDKKQEQNEVYIDGVRYYRVGPN
jgi:hypothetical protein